MRDNLRGIILMVASMAGFAIEDMFVKWAAADLPTGQILLALAAGGAPVFILLARRQGEVLSRTLIAEQVWDMNFDSDTNVVEVAIRRLRRSTLRHQIDWASLKQAYRDAYACVREDPQRYQRMSVAAIERMRGHCSQAVARERLAEFLDAESRGPQ